MRSTLLFGSVAAIRGFARGADALDLTSATRATPRLAGAKLVAAEVAIGLALSVSAALMIRSLINLRAVDLGFQTESTVAARVSLPSAKYESVEQRRAFFDALLTRVRAMPGVASASIATTRPFACCAPVTVVSDAIQSGTTVSTAPTTDVRYVDDAYFSTLRIAVVAGSVFGPPSRRLVRLVPWCHARLRALYGPVENAIGRRVSIKLFGNTVAEVIGVVDDVHLADARTPSRPAVFLSTARFPSTERDVIVRGSGDANALLGALRQSLAAVDVTIPLFRATSLDRAVATTWRRIASLRRYSPRSRCSRCFSRPSACTVFSRAMSRAGAKRLASGWRSVRMPRVTSMVFRRALTPAVVGVAIGIVLALVLARSMSALVFGIGADDAVTFLGVTVRCSLLRRVRRWFPRFVRRASLRSRRFARIDPSCHPERSEGSRPRGDETASGQGSSTRHEPDPSLRSG